MTAQEDPYVRVYYRALTDDKFCGLSSSAWGHWVRLLVVADGLYPAPAPLPRWVEDAPLTELVAAGIVDREGSDYYRIHGMKAEREGRTEAATFAADVKHHGRQEAERRRADRMRAHAGAVQPDAGAANGAAGGPAGLPLRSSPSLSSPNQSDPRHAEQPARSPSNDAYDVMLTVENLTRRPFNYREGHQVHDTLIGDVAQHGAERMADEYRRFREANGSVDAAQLVFGVHNALHPLIKAKPMTEQERKDAEIAAAIAQIKAQRTAA